MNEKGFSLVELIAVLVVLSIILLVSLPAILNVMKKTKSTMDNATQELLFANAQSYITDTEDQAGKVEGSVFCVTVKKLVDENYTKEPIPRVNKEESTDIINNKRIKARYMNNKFEFVLENNSATCIW